MASETRQLSHEQLQFMSCFWMGTWQNTDIEPTKEVFEAKKRRISFMIGQLEKAPTTGKLHYQLYIEFADRVRLCTLMRSFPHCYWSPRRGTSAEAIRYCSKEESREGDTFSFGTPKYDIEEKSLVAAPNEPRKKVSALQVACDQIKNQGKTLYDLANEQPHVFVRHHSGLLRLAAMLAPKRDFKPEVIALYGCPESGKSRTALEIAREHFDEQDIYRYSFLDVTGKEWWELYKGERCIIIEEMDGSKFKYERLLEIIDRYDTKVPIKGMSWEFMGRLIIFTSNYPPSTWYPDKMWKALKRRIDRTYKFMLVEDVTMETEILTYEPTLDQAEMHNSDEKEHFREMVAMNQEKGFAKKHRDTDVDIYNKRVRVESEDLASEDDKPFF